MPPRSLRVGDRLAISKSETTGRLEFCNDNHDILLQLPLTKTNGLYYCPVVSYTVGKLESPVDTPEQSDKRQHTLARRRPIRPARHLESELWAARLSHRGKWQLDHIPRHATGLPDRLDYHPFGFIDFKQHAQVKHNPSGPIAKQLPHFGQCFYVDFGFIRASTSDFSKPDPKHDRVVESFNGFTSYLLIANEASRYVWVLLCQTKEPPIEEMSALLPEFGLKTGGLSAMTVEVNSHAASPSSRRCNETSATKSNPLVQGAPVRMAAQNDGTAPSSRQFVLFFMAQRLMPDFGQRPYFTPPISTTVGSIASR